MAIKKQYGKKKSNLPIGLIVGGVVGGAAVVAIVLCFALSSAPKNSASQDAPKQMAAANQPTPSRSGQGIEPKSRQEAPTRVSSVTEAKAAVEIGPKAVSDGFVDDAPFRLRAIISSRFPQGRTKAYCGLCETGRRRKPVRRSAITSLLQPLFHLMANSWPAKTARFCASGTSPHLPLRSSTAFPHIAPTQTTIAGMEFFWANDGTLVTRNPGRRFSIPPVKTRRRGCAHCDRG